MTHILKPNGDLLRVITYFNPDTFTIKLCPQGNIKKYEWVDLSQPEDWAGWNLASAIINDGYRIIHVERHAGKWLKPEVGTFFDLLNPLLVDQLPLDPNELIQLLQISNSLKS